MKILLVQGKKGRKRIPRRHDQKKTPVHKIGQRAVFLFRFKSTVNHLSRFRRAEKLRGYVKKLPIRTRRELQAPATFTRCLATPVKYRRLP